MFETQPPLTTMHGGKKGRTQTEGFKGHRSKSLNHMQRRLQIRKKVRHVPISIKQIEQDEELAKMRGGSLENPIFDLQSLRKPVHMLDNFTRRQLA